MVVSNSNNSQNDSLGSAAGHTTQTADAPPPAAPEPALPHPPPAPAAAAVTAIENPPSDDDEPLTPAQIDALAAAHDEMEDTIKMFKQTQNEDAPLSPPQITALADEERGDDETDEKKKTAPTTEADDGSPPRLDATSPPQGQDQDIPTQFRSADPPASPPPPADHSQSLQSRQPQISVRSPPQSMMPSPAEVADPTLSTPRRDPLVPVLDATLVEDQPEMPVYDAVQVAEQTWMKKKKKYIFGGSGLLIGTAVTAGVTVSSNNAGRGNSTIDPEGVVLSTTRPSESFSPSQVPSLRRTLRPSRSLAPSTSLRPTASSRPSQIPSPRPSSMPTPSPPVYCGEINVLTDGYYYESSWDLVRIDTIAGTSYTTVVLEGSPEEEGHHKYEACLESGDYEFAIFDSCGDGILSPGYYSVTFDGAVIAQGGEFDSEERISFSLPLPSPQPSESSSPSELPSASFQPSESIIPSQSLTPSFQPSNSFSPSTYWSSLNWSRQGLGFSGDASDDFFGGTVAFSADAMTMVVGAPGRRYYNDDIAGYVKVYHREGEGSSWEQRGFTIHGEANGDCFGCSLALSDDGTTLSIGAPDHDFAGSDSGQVKVYKWDEAALDYVQIGDALYGAAADDRFGWSLDIPNGTILAVGTRNSDANGSSSAQVTVYAWDEVSSTFKQRGGAIDAAGYEYYRNSVSLSQNGQKLAVGSARSNPGRSDRGQVRVFEWDEATSNYVQLGDSLLGNARLDYFGSSVSISHDGTTLAIGATTNSENGQSASGQVKVFAWDEDASNFEQIGQSLYGKATEDRFGSSVALSSGGKTLAIGARQAYADKPGYVEVYGWDEASSEYKQLGQSLGGEASDDWFGHALALAENGRVLAVGAPRNDGNGTDSGRVEVFDIEL